jgi:RHS repeat-associated protein
LSISPTNNVAVNVAFGCPKDGGSNRADSSYTYDRLGHLVGATSPLSGVGSVSFAWRLDGLLASRSWSSGPASLVYGYDGAKRPVSECNGTAGSCSNALIDIERSYDQAGNVTSETQTLTGDDPTQRGTESYAYDAANRVLTDTLGTLTKTYTYDHDGNRLTVTVNNTLTDTFAFDATDETVSDAHGSTTDFTYDRYGNLTASGTSSFSSTAYTYDLADRMRKISQADGSSIGFTFNAAGHHATRTSTVGGTTTTIDAYSYLGASDTVLLDHPTSGTDVAAAIDALGDRLATCAGTSGSAWIIPDLHGNVAGQTNAAGTTFIDVFRYDAYGNAIGSSGGSSAIPTPWRFGGRIVESVTGSVAYDFDARSYVPDLGTFISLDTVAGSAQNPLTLNRYLYAKGNPATLVDPDGHSAMTRIYDWDESIADNPSGCSASGDPSRAPSCKPATGGRIHKSDPRQSTTMPYCNYEITTNCVATGLLDLGGSPPATTSPGASDPVTAALIDALGQVKNSGQMMVCNGMNGSAAKNCWRSAVRQELTIMCSDAGDDASNPSCQALAALTPNLVSQIPGALKLAVMIYGPALAMWGCAAVCLEALGVDATAAGGAGGVGAASVAACEETEGCEDAGIDILNVLEDSGRGCLGESFRADTPVALASGDTIAIADIRVGDRVEAYDPRTGKTGPHTVTAVMVHSDPAVEHLRLDSGTIETTPNHPFFTVDRGWVEAGKLLVGEQIKTESGAPAAVVGFTVDNHSADMWDLTVDGAHTFFVSSARVLVHNEDCADDWTDGTGTQSNLPGNNQVQNDMARAALQSAARQLGIKNVPSWAVSEWKLTLEYLTANGENLDMNGLIEEAIGLLSGRQ